MPLDWTLFGIKKKVEQEPPPAPEEKLGSSADDFVVIDSDPTAVGLGPNGAMYSQLPYALAGNHAGSSEPLTTSVIEVSALNHEVTMVQGFLSGVPFKLTTAETFEDMDSATLHHLRASQLISHVSEGISSDRFTYDFQVEKSVLHEAGCRDLG